MSTTIPDHTPAPVGELPPSTPGRRSSAVHEVDAGADGEWRLEVLDSVGSTNTYAARLPAWTAVRARTQSGGRGRTPDRVWVSDEGGLWLSAVVPCPEPRAQWETLPLAAGWAVVMAVRELGVAQARLRWPNDVMAGTAKLAGLLVERYTADTAVIGIGLNVFNRPEQHAPSLAGHTVSLTGLGVNVRSVDAAAAVVLRHVRAAHGHLRRHGFGALAHQLNTEWGAPPEVAITLNGDPAPVTCRFHGVDDTGRLLVKRDGYAMQAFAATDVALFREL